MKRHTSSQEITSFVYVILTISFLWDFLLFWVLSVVLRQSWLSLQFMKELTEAIRFSLPKLQLRVHQLAHRKAQQEETGHKGPALVGGKGFPMSRMLLYVLIELRHCSVLSTPQGTGYNNLKGDRRWQGTLSDFFPTWDNLEILDVSPRRTWMTISHRSERKRQRKHRIKQTASSLKRLTELASAYPSIKKKCKLIRLDGKGVVRIDSSKIQEITDYSRFRSKRNAQIF